MKERVLRSMFRRAWPAPSIDRLLRAALLHDDRDAADAWREFESSADFDHLTDGEMRLLGVVSKRLLALAPDSPMRVRIGGIERMNWSRSQLAIGEATSGLRALGAGSIAMLVIKGAGRAASGDRAARGRVVNDVDAVVKAEDLETSFDLLVQDHWVPAGSGTALYHRAKLASAIGINLVRGQFGNFDLHRTAFHPPYLSTADDPPIWQRSRAGELAGVAVCVPSATDTIAIALAHGALDAHKSSDWLADIALSIDSGEVDWALFESIVDRRGLHAPAAAALRYVCERLERPIPERLVTSIENRALRRPLALVAKLAEIRPKSGSIGLPWLVRAVAKQGRLLRGRRTNRVSAPGRRSVRGSLFTRRRVELAGARTLEQVLPLPDRPPNTPWAGTVDVAISVELPPVVRRLEFEINSSDRHHLRLRALAFNRGRRERILRFKFYVALGADEADLVLVSAPARSFNSGAPADLIERYGALPFRVVSLRAEKRVRT